MVHAIEQEFDCVCEIKELDGKPYDFLVEIDRSTDLSAIREFIDKHKLAGRSYIFKLGDISFTAEWMNYVDEDIIELYSAEWIDYVYEDDGIITIHVNVVANTEGTGWVLTATADANVASQLQIYVSVYYKKTEEDYWTFAGSGIVIIPVGQNSGSENITLSEGAGGDFNLVTEVQPSSDELYTYKIEKLPWQ